MVNLQNNIEGEVKLKEYLLRIGDLINVDGPFLTLFGDLRNGDLYLYDWVDSDESTNRFVIYGISAQSVLDYLAKKIGRSDLFSAAIDGLYYYADINPREISQYKINRLKELPSEYSEVSNDFFDDSSCPDLERILLYTYRTIATDANTDYFQPKASVISSTVAPVEASGSFHRAYTEQFVDPVMVFTLSSYFEAENTDDVSFIVSSEVNRFFDEELIIADVRKVNHLPTGKRLALYRE